MFDRLKDQWKPIQPGAGSFLPEEYVRERAESRANIVSLLLFGTVLFGVVGAFFVTNRAWSSVRERQAEINAQYTEQTKKIEQLQQLEKQKTAMLERAEVTTALLERVPRSILLAEVVNRMPAAITLTDFILDGKRVQEPKAEKAKTAKKSLTSKTKDGKPDEPAPKPRPPKMEFSIQIAGLSPNDEAVADFQAALKQCGLLEKVDLISSQETVVDAQSMRKFRVEAIIRPGADARNIEPLKITRGAMSAHPVAASAAPPRGEAPSTAGRLGSTLRQLLGGKPRGAVASGPESAGTEPATTGEK